MIYSIMPPFLPHTDTRHTLLLARMRITGLRGTNILMENDQKRFKCELCGKGFATKQRLKDHTNIHTGERPFMCKYCGASFANNGNCRMHERSMHLGHKR